MRRRDSVRKPLRRACRMTRPTTVRFVGGLFVTCVLLQRFAVPGIPVIALLLPVVLVWSAWGLYRGVLVVDRHRTLLWLAAAGVTALVVPVQLLLVNDPLVSVTSWALFMATWEPFALRLVDRSTATYMASLSVIVKTCILLAFAAIAMMISQLAGLRYSDWLAAVIPSSLLLHGYVITYPLSYGSGLYRANAWIGLEPSTVSFQLGLGLIAAMLAGARARSVVVLFAALLCTASGSGVIVAAIGLLVMLVHPIRRSLRRYALAGGTALVLALSTPLGTAMLARATSSSPDPSASLRGIQPYQYLWPDWISSAASVIFGRGPGSSQRLVDDTGILGLLVPTPAKIFVEYGLLAGFVLAGFLLVCFLDGPSRALSASLLVSLWVLQPGTTSAIFVLPLLLVVSWWSPKQGPVLEAEPDVVPLLRRFGRQLPTPAAGNAWES